MKIGMQHVALKKIAVFILRPLAPQRVMKVFISLAYFAAHREVPLTLVIERDIFDDIPQICATGWITQIAVIFFVSKLLVWRG